MPMWCSPDRAPLAWAAVGPGQLVGALEPLRRAHGRHRAAALVPAEPRELERLAAGLGPGPAVLLVVEDPAGPTLRARYAAPFLTTGSGRDVLLGWLRLERRALVAYAQLAAAVAQRPGDGAQAVVLLGPLERRYQELLDTLERSCDAAPGLQAFRWSAERIRRPALVRALRLGAAATIYSGHGCASGWHAYGGLRAADFAVEPDWSGQQASALMFSLACGSGAPPGFADQVVAHGIAGAVLAPQGAPLHEDNRRLAAALVGALGGGCRRLCDLLESVRAAGAALDGYAVIGDPGLRAAAAAGAGERGAAVFAPAPGADLAAARAAVAARYVWRGGAGGC
jgi:hypothetical protein